MKSAFGEFIQNMYQAPSKCLFKWINWIISKSNRNIRKILFVLGLYEYLERLKGKIRDGIFFRVAKSDNYSVFRNILVGHLGFQSVSYRFETPSIVYEK